MLKLRRTILNYIGLLDVEQRKHFGDYYGKSIDPELKRINDRIEELYKENIMLKKKYEGYDNESN